VRAVAVVVAAMWVSTAMAAGQVRETWNPPEARHEAAHAGKHSGPAHALHARSGSAHHATHEDHGHGAKPATKAKARRKAVVAVKKNSGGHKTLGSGAHRATVTHSDPHSAGKTHSPARHAAPHSSATHASTQHAHQARTGAVAHPAQLQARATSARSPAASTPERAKPAAALPVPHREPVVQTPSTPAAQPQNPATAPSQSLPPILH
jgi:hypothetical protein